MNRNLALLTSLLAAGAAVAAGGAARSTTPARQELTEAPSVQPLRARSMGNSLQVLLPKARLSGATAVSRMALDGEFKGRVEALPALASGDVQFADEPQDETSYLYTFRGPGGVSKAARLRLRGEGFVALSVDVERLSDFTSSLGGVQAVYDANTGELLSEDASLPAGSVVRIDGAGQEFGVLAGRVPSNTRVRLEAGRLTKFAVPAGLDLTAEQLLAMGRGLGELSRIFPDGNNRLVARDAKLEAGAVYALCPDRTTQVDFGARMMRQEAPIASPEAVVQELETPMAATADDGTKVVVLYDDSYQTKLYKCWESGQSGPWDGITDGTTGADNVKNAGVVRRGRKIYVTDQGNSALSASTPVKVLLPADPGQVRQVASFPVAFDSTRKAFAISLPADCPVGDYQVQIGSSADNYCTVYVAFELPTGLTERQLQSWAYRDVDGASLADNQEHLNWVLEGGFPGDAWLYGYRGELNSKGGRDVGIFGQRMVEVAMSIHGSKTTTPMRAAIHAYQVMGQRIYWGSGEGYYSNDNGFINHFDTLLKGSLKSPSGTKTAKELDVVAAEKAALGMGLKDKLTQSNGYQFNCGQCFNYGTNTAAMMRAMGIPSRAQYSQGGAGWPGSFHVWAEAYLPSSELRPVDPNFTRGLWWKFDSNRNFVSTAAAHMEGNIAPLVIDGFGDFLLNLGKKTEVDYKGKYESNTQKCSTTVSSRTVDYLRQINPALNIPTSQYNSYQASASSSPWVLGNVFTTGTVPGSTTSHVVDLADGYALNATQKCSTTVSFAELPELRSGDAQNSLVGGLGYQLYRLAPGKTFSLELDAASAARVEVLATLDAPLVGNSARYSFLATPAVQRSVDGKLTVDTTGTTNGAFVMVQHPSSQNTNGKYNEVTFFSLKVDGGGNVNQAPVANFNWTAEKRVVTFADKSTDADGRVASWLWNFGDGQTSTSQNPTYTYAADGTFTVTLTVKDDKGASSKAYSASVTVKGDAQNQPPVADFSFTTDQLTARFTDKSSDPDGTVKSWLWAFGDGKTSTVQNPTYTYAAAGTYQVTLTVTDDKGASVTTQAMAVTVTKDPAPNQAPVADFSFSTNKLNAAFTDKSSDSDGQVSAWLWEFPGGQTSTVRNPAFTFAAAGTYPVSLTVKDDKGAASPKTTRQVTVVANQAPVADFTFAVSGLTAAFTNSSQDADGSIVSSAWTFGSAGSSSAASPSFTFPAAGTYDVTLKVTDNDGAQATKTQKVLVSAPTGDPVITTQPKSISVKSGQTAAFSVVATNAAGYQWYRQDINGSRALTGATASSFSFKTDWFKDNGAQFWVVVKGANGKTVTSTKARLSVSMF